MNSYLRLLSNNLMEFDCQTGVNISLRAGTLAAEEFWNLEIFRKSLKKSWKKWPLLMGKGRKKSRYTDFLAKKFGKVSSRFRKNFDFHEKYLPLYNWRKRKNIYVWFDDSSEFRFSYQMRTFEIFNIFDGRNHWSR